MRVGDSQGCSRAGRGQDNRMAMIFCGHCGESAIASELFCVSCGGKLRLPAHGAATDVVSSQAAAFEPSMPSMASMPSSQRDADATVAAATVLEEDGIALRYALDLLAKGDAKTAKVILLRLTEEQPRWAVARAYLGIAYMRLTEVADARVELERAVADDPESFICHSRYAELLARLGFYDKAMRQLDVALDLGAPDTDSRYAAMELRQFCKDKSKGIFYRELAYPKFSVGRAWPFRRANKADATKPT